MFPEKTPHPRPFLHGRSARGVRGIALSALLSVTLVPVLVGCGSPPSGDKATSALEGAAGPESTPEATTVPDSGGNLGSGATPDKPGTGTGTGTGTGSGGGKGGSGTNNPSTPGNPGNPGNPNPATDPPKSKTVPRVVGKPEKTAIDLITAAGLKPSTKTEAVPTCGDPVGTVRSVSPGEEQPATVGSTVTITVGVAKTVTVPSVIGQPVNAAIDAIRAPKLEPSTREQRVAWDSGQAGRVLAVEPAEGSQVNCGSPVVLVIGVHIPEPERDYGGFPADDRREVGWSEFGGREYDAYYGGLCSPGYQRSNAWFEFVEITQWNGRSLGNATIGWANGNSRDCTVLVHYSIETPGVFQRNNVVAVRIVIKETGL